MNSNNFYLIEAENINRLLGVTVITSPVIVYRRDNGRYEIVIADIFALHHYRDLTINDITILQHITSRIVVNYIYNKKVRYVRGTDNNLIINFHEIQQADWINIYSNTLKSYIRSLTSWTADRFNDIYTTNTSWFTNDSGTSKPSINKDKMTNEKLKSIFKYIPIRYDYNDGFYDYKNNKIVLFYSNGKTNVLSVPRNINILDYFSETPLIKICKFKVKDYRKSSELFKFGGIKKELVGKEVSISQLELEVKVKRSDNLENTLYINHSDRRYRFVLEDIEIIYPNINGYHLKKDRKIRPGNKVRVINDRHMNNVKRNDIIKVTEIKKIGNKQYVGFEKENKIIYHRVNKFKKI